MLFPFHVLQGQSPACTVMGALLVLGCPSPVWLGGNKVVLSQLHAARPGSRIPAGLTLCNTDHAINQVGKLLWTTLIRNSGLTTRSLPLPCSREEMSSHQLTTKSCLGGKAMQPFWAPAWCQGCEEYIAASCLPALVG